MTQKSQNISEICEIIAFGKNTHKEVKIVLDTEFVGLMLGAHL